MLKTSVSDLKASASEYLTKVKAGEEILVTDRGRPIAKIIPLRRDELPADVRMVQLELAGLARVEKGDLLRISGTLPVHRTKRAPHYRHCFQNVRMVDEVLG